MNIELDLIVFNNRFDISDLPGHMHLIHLSKSHSSGFKDIGIFLINYGGNFVLGKVRHSYKRLRLADFFSLFAENTQNDARRGRFQVHFIKQFPGVQFFSCILISSSNPFSSACNCFNRMEFFSRVICISLSAMTFCCFVFSNAAGEIPPTSRSCS